MGDSRDVIKRIRYNHCSGNVEASALRRAVAESLGFPLRYSERKSGSIRIRLAMDNPRYGEEIISSYLSSGRWKYIICNNYKEAHDFQWYVIEKLKPILNKDSKQWDCVYKDLYGELFIQLENQVFMGLEELTDMKTGSGVYVLYHEFLAYDRARKQTFK